mmetsp:Transcript_1447/g.2419  ORF Transcript_1447/g.2419 Transcript_1447/m.2419 type:complete len:202 (-) Transcript_1447:379-984(-)
MGISAATASPNENSFIANAMGAASATSPPIAVNASASLTSPVTKGLVFVRSTLESISRSTRSLMIHPAPRNRNDPSPNAAIMPMLGKWPGVAAREIAMAPGKNNKAVPVGLSALNNLPNRDFANLSHSECTRTYCAVTGSAILFQLCFTDEIASDEEATTDDRGLDCSDFSSGFSLSFGVLFGTIVPFSSFFSESSLTLVE